MPSRIVSLMFTRSFRGGEFLTRARIRLITSPARVPSLIMRSTARRAASRFGVSPVSQRKQAFPLLTNPVSGWLTSWAIAAVSSPRVVTRATRVSSAECAFLRSPDRGDVHHRPNKLPVAQCIRHGMSRSTDMLD